MDVTTLPYNQPLIDWLKEERAVDKRIVLCSATNMHVALAVSDYLQLFDDVIASDATTNIKSANKCLALEEQFGKKGFDYAGNSSADIEVWAGARQAIMVNASRLVHDKATQVATESHTFPSKAVTLSD